MVQINEAIMMLLTKESRYKAEYDQFKKKYNSEYEDFKTKVETSLFCLVLKAT